MLEQFYVDPSISRRLRDGPIGRELDAFVAAERQQGFRSLTIREHLRVIRAFSGWLERVGLVAKDLGESCIAEFIRDRRRRGGPQREGYVTLQRLLSYLRGVGSVPGRAPEHEQKPTRSNARWQHSATTWRWLEALCRGRSLRTCATCDKCW